MLCLARVSGRDINVLSEWNMSPCTAERLINQLVTRFVEGDI